MEDRKAEFARNFARFLETIDTAGEQTDAFCRVVTAELFVAD